MKYITRGIILHVRLYYIVYIVSARYLTSKK